MAFIKSLIMSFFNWLFGKPSLSLSPEVVQKSTANPPSEKRPAFAAKSDAMPQESAFSAMRHARREQLFRAIRDAMTQAGVLSFRYKFKVLSQDRRGNSFVVLIDLTHVNGDGMPSISEMEALIVQSAAKRYDIAVSAVYWRFHEMEAVVSRTAHAVGGATPMARPVPAGNSLAAARASAALARQPASDTVEEPIQLEEITAFQRALLSAEAQARTTPVAQQSEFPRAAAALPAEPKYFEETHTAALEAASFPALSSTQYGDLR